MLIESFLYGHYRGYALLPVAMNNLHLGELHDSQTFQFPILTNAAVTQCMPFPHSSLKKSMIALIPLEPNPCCMLR
jgi:hypothetical protein